MLNSKIISICRTFLICAIASPTFAINKDKAYELVGEEPPKQVISKSSENPYTPEIDNIENLKQGEVIKTMEQAAKLGIGVNIQKRPDIEQPAPTVVHTPTVAKPEIGRDYTKLAILGIMISALIAAALTKLRSRRKKQ